LSRGKKSRSRRLAWWFAGALTVGVCLLSAPAGSAETPTLVPALDEAANDKGEMARGHCRALDEAPIICSYGDLASDNTVALIGDSHALQWGPALIQLATQRDWRLIAIIKTGCLIADVKFEATCDRWRARALESLAGQQPRHVIVGTSIGRRYRLEAKGRRLTRRASDPLLTAGMTRTLKRIRSIPSLDGDGSGVTLIRDQVTAPFLPVRCLEEHPHHPETCRFPRHRRFGPGFEAEAARRAGVTDVIDPLGALCGGKWCYSVRDGMVLYRDSDHLTATFVRSLTGWLGAKLDF